MCHTKNDLKFVCVTRTKILNTTMHIWFEVHMLNLSEQSWVLKAELCMNAVLGPKELNEKYIICVRWHKKNAAGFWIRATDWLDRLPIDLFCLSLSLFHCLSPPPRLPPPPHPPLRPSPQPPSHRYPPNARTDITVLCFVVLWLMSLSDLSFYYYY